MTLLQIHEPGQTPEPHASEEGIAIGIDLGTTHSVVAASCDGRPVALGRPGDFIIPSVVQYIEDKVLVGKEVLSISRGSEATAAIHSSGQEWTAASANASSQNGAIHSIKRLMSHAAQTVATQQGEKTPVEISAEILKACKARAEAVLEAKVHKAVITVPAYFDDTARTATRDAARLAGLEVLRLINEPTAAALAYGLDSGAEGIYAIYDFGGGTFDMSILRLAQGVFQVLATGGDTQLGGDDIDVAIASYLRHPEGANASEGSMTPHHGSFADAQDDELRMLARAIKEALTDKTEIAVTRHPSEGWDPDSNDEQDGDNIGPGLRQGDKGAFTRDQLNALASPIIAKTLSISEQVMRDAGLEANEIQGVVLVGGSTRMPLVRENVKAFFKQEPLTDLDPDQIVALGAALQAEALTVGSENLLLDVTPLSLGLETMGGIVEKVIHRNTPIPVSKAQEFTTYQDGQTGMKIKVLQGEREMVEDCRELADFTLTNIPPLPANVARIKVTFTVDADGLLTVSASEETTGVQQRVEVKPTYGLSIDQMETMLRDSMEHAREDITERLLREARVEAERLLYDLDAALGRDGELLNGEERAEIDMHRGVLEEAIKGADRDIIDAQVQTLDAICQPFAQKRMDKAVGAALKGKSLDEVSELKASSS